MRSGITGFIVMISIFFCIFLCTCTVLKDVGEDLAELCDEAHYVSTELEGDDSFRLCSGGACTLRDAIAMANACGGDQTILLPSGTYVVTSPDLPAAGSARSESMNEDMRSGRVAFPRITANITIEGLSSVTGYPADVHVIRRTSTGSFSIFHVME